VAAGLAFTPALSLTYSAAAAAVAACGAIQVLCLYLFNISDHTHQSSLAGPSFIAVYVIAHWTKLLASALWREL